MKNILIYIFFLLLVSGNVDAQSQNIKIHVNEKSLNKVLLDLGERYGFQFVFDDDLLSKYLVSINKEFNSGDEAFKFLLKGLPLKIEKSGDIFIIIPFSEEIEVSKKEKVTQIEGQIVEEGSNEPLPFSYIVINNRQVQSDQNGNFSFIASADSSFNMRISHLGYFVFDTIFTNSINKRFKLSPSVKELGEVMVEGFDVERSTLIGDTPGQMKINNTIAPYLPGYGDNSVYNLLRLMPGVLASGEQSSDLMVWGSYESHSKIKFDGFSIFGLKNFNDNIGVVNPLLIKNIQVLKGGFEAEHDDRVGGIVNITGKSGNSEKPSFTFNINNATVNTLFEVPIGKKSLFLGAYRQTYYELYDPYDLNVFGDRGKNSMGNRQNSILNSIDVLVSPKYKFRDFNLKYTVRGDNGSVLSAGVYRGGDSYSYDIDGEYDNHQIKREEDEKNLQFGSSVSYGKKWKNGHNSNLTISYSALDISSNQVNTLFMGHHNRKREVDRTINVSNNIREYSAEFENNFSLFNGHQIDIGLGYKINDIQLEKNISDKNQISLNSKAQRIYAFIQDNLPISEKLILKPGIRTNYYQSSGGIYVDPRLAVSLKVNKAVKINASWGIYHQFLAKTSLVDSSFNYTWFWANSDDNTIPVLEGMHWVGGVSYNFNDFLFSAEGYYKETKGISRFFSGTQSINRGFYSGESISYGVDFYAKKEFKKNLVWISYTLGKVKEFFHFYKHKKYRLAPHDQRHELKIAGIYNLNSFYFSANYVYGSGFERMRNFLDEGESLPIYSRLDAAIIYKFRKAKIFGELGFSVLNVLNYQNIKFSNLKRIPSGNASDINVNSEAVPFTPTLFLKIKL